jgi:4-carboxymuconolactone decarboxylase
MGEHAMSKLDQKAEAGLEVIAEMMGPNFGASLRTAAEADDFGSDITRMALRFAFSDAWGREGFDRKSKSMVVISALIALRQSKELKNHVKIGLTNGLSISDFESILVQLTPYVGFPCIASARTDVVEALREAGRDPATKTSEERGLL